MSSRLFVWLVLAALAALVPVHQGDLLGAEENVRPTDCYGDPLPPGAVMRLGTSRFRGFGLMAAYSPDGKLLATAGYDGVVLWDAQSGRQRAFLESRLTPASMPRNRTVYRLAFSSDGRYLAAGCKGEAIVWELASGAAFYLPGDEKASVVDLVGFTSDNRGILTGDDNEIRLRDWRTGKDLKRWLLPGSRPLQNRSPRCGTKALSADGRIVASYIFDSDSNYSLQIWDVASGKAHRIDGVHGLLALSPDHTTLAALDGKLTLLTLFDVATGKVIRSWPMERQTNVSAGDTSGEPFAPPRSPVLAFSPDGKSIATPGTVWSRATGKELCKLEGDSGPTFAVCFSPDGKTLAAIKGSCCIDFWDLPTGRRLHNFPNHRGHVVDLAYSPDGRQLATAGTDKTVRLWDTRTGRLMRVFEKQGHSIQSLAFFPDGRRLATEHYTSVVIWDVSAGKELREIAVPDFAIHSLAVSPDGKTVLAAGQEEGTANPQPRHIPVLSGITL